MIDEFQFFVVVAVLGVALAGDVLPMFPVAVLGVVDALVNDLTPTRQISCQGT